jgi:hypothetical protein
MSRNERDFTAEFNLSFKLFFESEPYYYHKIRDDGLIQMYDAHLWWKNHYAGIEFKFNRAKTSINMAKLFSGRDHQIRNLKQRISMGHSGWVIINWFLPKEVNRTFLISPDTAQHYIDKGTVKMEEFTSDQKVKEIKRKLHESKPYWDFKYIL